MGSQSHALTLEEAIARALAEGDERSAVAMLRRAFGRSSETDADDLVELLEELAEYFIAADRPEDAIGAAGRALLMTGDADDSDAVRRRCRIAEILLKAGLTEEACAVYAALSEALPDQTCVHEAAGNDFLDVGDPDLAYAWLTAGLEQAVANGDANGCLTRLLELRRVTMAELGWGRDDLDVQASELVRRSRPQRVADLLVLDEFDGSGADPDRAMELLAQLRQLNRSDRD